MHLPLVDQNTAHARCLNEDYHKAQQSVYFALRDFDEIRFAPTDYPMTWNEAFKSRNAIRESLLKALFYLEAHATHTAPELK